MTDWTWDHTLMSVTQQPYLPSSVERTHPDEPLRRHNATTLVVVAILGVLVMAGVAVIAFAIGAKNNKATPTPGTPVAAASSAATTDATKQICDLNNKIVDVMQQGDLIRQIAAIAATSTDFDVRFNANMLGDRYDLATHAKGGPNEFTSTMGLMTAHINLGTACIKAGWKPGD